jgi:hypothetical protein
VITEHTYVSPVVAEFAAVRATRNARGLCHYVIGWQLIDGKRTGGYFCCQWEAQHAL